MNYEAFFVMEPAAFPGVRVEINRMSFGRRVELARQVRQLGERLEFLEAGKSQESRAEANLLAGEIDRILLRWGLRSVTGMTINGAPATPEAVIDEGPEELCRALLAAIKAECGLTEEERKN